MTRIYGKGQDHDGVKWEVTESHLPVPVVHISTADWLNVGGLHLTVAQAKQFVTAIQEAMADAVTGGLHEHLVGAACEFCGDQGPLLLQSVCHLTAPLQAILDRDTLTLRCYLPDCGRTVTRFEVVRQ